MLDTLLVKPKIRPLHILQNDKVISNGFQEYGNLLSFLLRCSTRPYERGTQWFFKNMILNCIQLRGSTPAALSNVDFSLIRLNFKKVHSDPE